MDLPCMAQDTIFWDVQVAIDVLKSRVAINDDPLTREATGALSYPSVVE